MSHLFPAITHLSDEEQEAIHQAAGALATLNQERTSHLNSGTCLGETRSCPVCARHAAALNTATTLFYILSKHPKLGRGYARHRDCGLGAHS